MPWVRPPVDRHCRAPMPAPLRADCGCGAATVPGVVLDPFIGAGTTALAAERHGRHWVGIELNPVFAALAMQRLEYEYYTCLSRRTGRRPCTRRPVRLEKVEDGIA
jgi:hypothetical protein